MIALRQALERARRRRVVGVLCIVLLVLLVLLVSAHLSEDAQHVSAAACLVAIVGLLLAVRSTAPIVCVRASRTFDGTPRPPPCAVAVIARSKTPSSPLPLLL